MLFLDDLLNIQCRLKYFEKRIDGIGKFIGGQHLADILTIEKSTTEVSDNDRFPIDRQILVTKNGKYILITSVI